MWRIYSKDKMGIRIKTTAGALSRVINEFHQGKTGVWSGLKKVVYQTEEDLKQTAGQPLLDFTVGVGVDKSVLLKRKAFEHEQEIRLFYYDGEKNIRGRRGWNTLSIGKWS